jgi:hypothetical protein
MRMWHVEPCFRVTTKGMRLNVRWRWVRDLSPAGGLERGVGPPSEQGGIWQGRNGRGYRPEVGARRRLPRALRQSVDDG